MSPYLVQLMRSSGLFSLESPSLTAGGLERIGIGDYVRKFI